MTNSKKKSYVRLFLVVAFLSIVSTANSVVNSTASLTESNVCKEDYKVLNYTTQIQMGTFGGGECFISIDPFNSLNLIYRSYIMVTDSSLMIFNSYGDGPPSTTSGARLLYFFPRNQSLNYQVNSKFVNIEMSGQSFDLDILTAKFAKIEGLEFQEDPQIRKDNNGGLKILSSKRLYLDTGFKVGGDPRSDQKRMVYFHDTHDFACELINSEVFDYKVDVDNPIFKFSSDKELASFLKLRCPQLDLASSQLF